MQRLQAYRFELQPKAGQAQAFKRVAGCCRYVYNRALAEQRERRTHGEAHAGYALLCRQLTGWRRAPETAFLAASPTHPLQQALKDLGSAYTNFFAGHARPPRFKKRGGRDSFRYPDPAQFRLDQTNRRLFLPKIGWVRYRQSRPVEGDPKNLTVSCRAGRWFVSVQTERTVPDPVHASDSAVGVDMGVARFATLSDGTVYEPLNSFRRLAQRLAWEQRKLARKRKYSSNWKKQKSRITRLHCRIADARVDYLHKTSTTLCKNHAMVAIEDLQVANMSASAKGTVDCPGSRVAAKAGLNKAILDQGWRAFRQMLEYKLGWAGGWLVAVDSRYTSQTCSACHHIDAGNRASQERFACVRCGYSEHADLNAAYNILRAGHARSACSMPVGIESQAQGSKVHWGLLAGTTPVGAIPGIAALQGG